MSDEPPEWMDTSNDNEVRITVDDIGDILDDTVVTVIAEDEERGTFRVPEGSTVYVSFGTDAEVSSEECNIQDPDDD